MPGLTLFVFLFEKNVSRYYENKINRRTHDDDESVIRHNQHELQVSLKRYEFTLIVEARSACGQVAMDAKTIRNVIVFLFLIRVGDKAEN